MRLLPQDSITTPNIAHSLQTPPAIREEIGSDHLPDVLRVDLRLKTTRPPTTPTACLGEYAKASQVALGQLLILYLAFLTIKNETDPSSFWSCGVPTHCKKFFLNMLGVKDRFHHIQNQSPYARVLPIAYTCSQ